MSCGGAQFCDWLDNRCGRNATTTAGECRLRPNGCAGIYEPTCGCDGQVYSSECHAQSLGQDVSEAGGCTPPANMFPCGPRFCVLGSQYCHATIGGPVGASGSYSCVAYPNTCGDTPTCACLSATACGANCVMSAPLQLRTTCYAP
jgi:hypothetical protein